MIQCSPIITEREREREREEERERGILYLMRNGMVWRRVVGRGGGGGGEYILAMGEKEGGREEKDDGWGKWKGKEIDRDDEREEGKGGREGGREEGREGLKNVCFSWKCKQNIKTLFLAICFEMFLFFDLFLSIFF